MSCSLTLQQAAATTTPKLLLPGKPDQGMMTMIAAAAKTRKYHSSPRGTAASMNVAVAVLKAQPGVGPMSISVLEHAMVGGARLSKASRLSLSTTM